MSLTYVPRAPTPQTMDADEIGKEPLEFLKRIVNGEAIECRQITDDGEIVLQTMVPSLEMRTNVALKLINKQIPDLKSTEIRDAANRRNPAARNGARERLAQSLGRRADAGVAKPVPGELH